MVTRISAATAAACLFLALIVPSTVHGRPAIYAAGLESEAVAIGDLDGDGDRDVVYINQGISTVTVLFNDGAGAFPFPIAYDSHDSPQDVRVGDVNSDGANDLVVTNLYSSDISVLLNKGAGIFAAAVKYQSCWSSSPTNSRPAAMTPSTPLWKRGAFASGRF